MTYTYDNLNQLSSLQEPDPYYATGGGTISFTYDNKGQLTSRYIGGNLTTYYYYDKGGRLTETRTDDFYGASDTIVDDYVYSYTIGTTYTTLRASVNSTLGSATWATSYSYDHLNRLTGASSTGTYPMTSSYSYDANGNRTAGSTTGTGASTPYNYTYQYDTANQLKQVNSTTCTNDGNGNQTGCGTSYKETYNPRNQTTSMSGPSGSLGDQYVGTDSTQRTQTSSSRSASYTYNLLGLGTEKDSSGNQIAYTRDNKGNLLSMRTSNGVSFYVYDGLGSVVGLMDHSGNLINTYVYDPYGVTQHQTGTQYNPWQFAGGYFDASTLYYKYGTRYYDRFGRWTQQDSQPSANPYIYANDDPVNVVDPSGRDGINFNKQFLKACILGAVGGVAGLVVAAIIASALAIAFVPITILVIIQTAIAGCLGGVIVAAVGDILDALVGS